MDTYLTRRLIKEFTRPGEVVLDPMAGVGTTGVEAVLLGRHTILIDIENKFTELCKKNLENVEKIFGNATFKPKLGKSTVITGDSRRLSQLLQHVDAIVTSPPYSQSVGHQGGLDKSNFKHGCRYRERYPKSKDNIGNLKHDEAVDTILTSPPYSESMTKRRKGYTVIPELAKTREMPQDTRDDNIANLQHGSVDAILTSPPYADIHQCPTNTGLTEFFRKQLEEKGYIEWNGKRYTEAEWRAMNHGRLDGRSTPGVKKDAKYSENPENIGNLPHTENVDAILTSPPYSNIAKSKEGAISPHMQGLISKLSGIPVKEFANNVEKLKEAVKIAQSKIPFQYSENPDNIGNLPHGNIDTIITSPPYGEAQEGAGIAKRGYQGNKHSPTDLIGKRSYVPGKFENPENISRLPHGNIDAVITSPPYQNALHDTLEKRKKWKAKQMHEDKKGLPVGYSENPENIGNIKQHGSVDVILTSPPYLEGIGHSCHPENIGVRTDEQIKQTQAFKAKTELAKKHLQIKMSSKENIGSLKHGEVDTILTSPPFGESLNNKSGGMKGKRNLPNQELSLKGDPQQYSDNPENIGNLTYPELDETIKRLRKHGRTDPKQGGSYGRSLAHPYSSNPANIGNLPHGNVDATPEIIEQVQKLKSEKKDKSESYLSAMLKVYSECYKVLKPKGLMLVVLKNFVRREKVVNLIGDTERLCEHVGFKLEKRVRFILPTKSFWRLLYEKRYQQKYGKGLPPEFDSVYKYETVLIFRKV